MVILYYVGFNAYQQCPNTGNVPQPKIVKYWKECPFKTIEDVTCTFRNLVIKTKNALQVYGYVNENQTFRLIDYKISCQAFLATNDYLFITEGRNISKSEYNDEWCEIPVIFPNDGEVCNIRNILKISYLQSTNEIVVLVSDGSVWCLDQCNKLSNIFTPSLDKAKDICCGFEHILILTCSGCVFTVGNGSHGQLGHGDLESSAEPLQVLGLGGLKVVKIASAGWHSCAVTDGGDLYVWGWNNYGQLTDIEPFSEIGSNGCEIITLPTLINPDPDRETAVVDIACGTRHTVIITDNDELFATGWNEYGQLGISDPAYKIIKRFTKSALPPGVGKKRLICGPWSTILWNE